MNHYSLGIWQIGRERIIHLLITLISTALAKYTLQEAMENFVFPYEIETKLMRMYETFFLF